MKTIKECICERFGDHFTKSNIIFKINDIEVEVENKDYYDRWVKYDHVNIETIKTAIKNILSFIENPDNFNSDDFDIAKISFGLSSYKKHKDELGFKFFKNDDDQEIFMVRWFNDKVEIADDKNDMSWYYNIDELIYIFRAILKNS